MLQNFMQVGAQVAVLFILIAVGALLTKLNIINEQGARVMTDVVLLAVTPCVIINAFQRDFEPHMLKGLLIALLCAAVITGASIALAELMYHRQTIDRGVVLKFSLVFSNCGFMALPLQEAILGKDGVFYGAAFIAVFNLFMWTYGIIIMSGKTTLKTALKAILNPGVIGTVIGLMLFLFSVKLPSVVLSPIGFLAGLNTPVPMLIIGYHLVKSDLKSVLKQGVVYPAIFLRLVGIPLIALFIMWLCGVNNVILTSVVIATASPVAAATTMMASKYRRDVALSAGIVSASSLFSMVTLPLVVGLARTLGR